MTSRSIGLVQFRPPGTVDWRRLRPTVTTISSSSDRLSRLRIPHSSKSHALNSATDRSVGTTSTAGSAQRSYCVVSHCLGDRSALFSSPIKRTASR